MYLNDEEEEEGEDSGVVGEEECPRPDNRLRNPVKKFRTKQKKK